MKKKLKLFMTVASLCLALAVLCFGVFSATQISYTIGGTISYEIEDVFVKITTKVYTSNAQVDNIDDLKDYANKFVNSTPTSLGEYEVTNLTNYNDIFDFNSLTNELDENDSYSPQSKIEMVFGEKANAYSMYIVMNIVNLADSIVYTHVNSFTNDIENIVGCTSDSDLRIFKTETDGQTIVLAYSLKDKKQGVEISDFSFSLGMRCTEPYSYGQLSTSLTPDGDYHDKVKSITITNNEADFSLKDAYATRKVGSYGDNNDLFAYYIKNGDMYDEFVYAPVNVIYTEQNADATFGWWVASFSDGTYNISDMSKVEILNLKSLDTSKSNIFSGFILNTYSLKKLENFERLDFSKGNSFNGMLAGLQIDCLDMSNMKISEGASTFAMLGSNDEYLSLFMKSLGATEEQINSIIKLDLESKKVQVANMLCNSQILGSGNLGWYKALVDSAYNTKIDKIIAPAYLPKDVQIALTGEYIIEGTDEITNFLVAGKTLIRKS